MPDITGQVISLTVTDADRSAAWYCDLLGAQETGRYVQPDGHMGQIQLSEPRSGLELCLVAHDADAGSFSEFRAGLDHLTPRVVLPVAEAIQLSRPELAPDQIHAA